MESNKSINILFLGGSKRVSLGERFISAGKSLGIQVNLFSYELDKNVPISSIAKIIVGLRWQDPLLFDHLDEITEKENINIILPFVDPAIVLLSKYKEKRQNIFIPLSDEKICETFFNKEKSHTWFIDNNFSVPNDIQVYPKIAKPITGSASQGIIIISDNESMKEFKSKFHEKNYLIQRLIAGDEYTVDSYISRENKILATVPRKRIEVTGGEVTKALTVRDEELISLTNDVVTKAKLKGPVNVQFIKEKETNQIFIMEINTRFGGGVIASIEAGADFTKMIIHEYYNIQNEQITNWKENLLMMRANREFFTYATDY